VSTGNNVEIRSKNSQNGGSSFSAVADPLVTNALKNKGRAPVIIQVNLPFQKFYESGESSNSHSQKFNTFKNAKNQLQN
ncbi:hypothetical protein LMQ07_14835, partial [Staphylococcus aureus]|uniref:hypothetical protein n=1 Tax=Staphylococcus aureus TaxID=1280 RepID=UPI001E48E23F